MTHGQFNLSANTYTCANTLRKGMNPTIFTLAMSKIVGHYHSSFCAMARYCYEVGIVNLSSNLRQGCLHFTLC